MTSTPHQILFGQSRRMRQVGQVACVVDSTDAYRVFEGKLEGKRQLWRPRHRCDDNIQMDLQEVRREHGRDCSGSGFCDYGNEPSGSKKCGEFLA